MIAPVLVERLRRLDLPHEERFVAFIVHCALRREGLLSRGMGWHAAVRAALGLSDEVLREAAVEAALRLASYEGAPS